MGIKIGALASEITKLMQEYAEDVSEDMKEEAKAVAKETVEELKRHPLRGMEAVRGIIIRDGHRPLNAKRHHLSEYGYITEKSRDSRICLKKAMQKEVEVGWPEYHILPPPNSRR